jgi:Na+-translocating ferredoxin:NAD+ oxidoreductase RnfC subunit
MLIDRLKKIIEDAGVVGAGGAGFPTHLKMDKRADTLLLNCAECEPLFKVHQQLLTRYAADILSALHIIADTLGASLIIAIKKSYGETINAVQLAAAGYPYPAAKIALLDDTYPAGDEILLIYEAAGVVVPPGTLPIESGFLVLNVETVYNIHLALTNGAPVTHKWVTIAGEVKKPVTARIPLGTTLRKAAERAGGITTANPAFITGGPMMGGISSENEVVTKITNAILVLPAGHPSVKKINRDPGTELNRAASACCQCHTCTDMCPRNLLGYPVEPHRFMRALRSLNVKDTEAYKGLMYCCLCGLCEIACCPQSLAPRTLMKMFKGKLTKAGVKPEKREAAPVHKKREYRRVGEKRLKIRLGLTQYDLEAPMAEGENL